MTTPSVGAARSKIESYNDGTYVRRRVIVEFEDKERSITLCYPEKGTQELNLFKIMQQDDVGQLASFKFLGDWKEVKFICVNIRFGKSTERHVVIPLVLAATLKASKCFEMLLDKMVSDEGLDSPLRKHFELLEFATLDTPQKYLDSSEVATLYTSVNQQLFDRWSAEENFRRTIADLSNRHHFSFIQFFDKHYVKYQEQKLKEIEEKHLKNYLDANSTGIVMAFLGITRLYKKDTSFGTVYGLEP